MQLIEWYGRFLEEPHRFSPIDMTWRLVHAVHVDALANNSLTEQHIKDLEFASGYVVLTINTKVMTYESEKVVNSINTICKDWQENGIINYELLEKTKEYLEIIFNV